jgi:hypothetical protein
VDQRDVAVFAAPLNRLRSPPHSFTAEPKATVGMAPRIRFSAAIALRSQVIDQMPDFRNL